MESQSQEVQTNEPTEKFDTPERKPRQERNPNLQRTVSTGSSTRYSLINEGEIQVCRINHHKSLLQKIIYSRPLRKWETHKIVLSDNHLHSTTPKGYMTFGLAYNEIQEVVRGVRNGSGTPYALHLIVPRSGSLLMQMNNAYTRDQWFYSLVWKITACRFKKLFSKIKTPEDLTREMQDLVHFCMTNPISDPIVFQLPMNSISSLLLHHGHEINDKLRTEIIKVISPILEMTALTPSICKCFQRITRNHPHVDIGESFLGSVHRVLKHNTDFGKFPHLRMFVQDYLCYVYSHDETKNGVDEFIQDLHTANTSCPHPRALPNLVTVSLAAIYAVYEETETKEDDKKTVIACFKAVYEALSQFSDWRTHLAVLLQAVPFPKDALLNPDFNSALATLVLSFAEDERCEIHQCLFPIREDRDGWINHFSPVGGSCYQDGHVFDVIMSNLIPCCLKRKKMLVQLKTNFCQLFTLMAIRGNKDCIAVLIGLLDFDLTENEEENLELIAALQSSDEGNKQYEELCLKRQEFSKMEKSTFQDVDVKVQVHFVLELGRQRLKTYPIHTDHHNCDGPLEKGTFQDVDVKFQKEAGGPHKLTLPSQSTDEDLVHVLKSGSFGNLRSLNLSFTRITSESAKYIIQLPNLLHLNLWATGFDDEGLQLISEHLQDLQSLNLCETSVTDDGLHALLFLENLRILNLNSTKLSALTYESLKEKLTDLQVVDIRYTEAY